MPAYRDKRDGRWRYRKVVKLFDGKRVKISGTPAINTRAAAEADERAEIARIVAGGGKRKEAPYFEDFVKEFQETYVLVQNKPSEQATKASVFRVHLIPAFGKRRLNEIDAEAIDKFKAQKLTENKAPKSINNYLTVLRRTLSVARKWKRIEFVPDFDWMRAPKPDFDFLDFEEAERLVKAAEGEWKTMILTAMRTGLRLGELRALRWQDVDLVAGRLRVKQAVAGDILGTPKSGRAREVPLSPETARALKAHRHLRGELVFCTDAGRMFKKNETKHPLWRACKRAGLRLIGWHALRHTFASHLTMRAVPLKAIQELLGHATIEMTMRYSHLSPEVRRDAVITLDRRVEPVLESHCNNDATADVKSLNI